MQHVDTVGEFAQWHESTPREDIGEDSYNEPEEFITLIWTKMLRIFVNSSEK